MVRRIGRSRARLPLYLEGTFNLNLLILAADPRSHFQDELSLCAISPLEL